MIKDSDGINIIPGNFGRDCPGNGEHFNEFGELIECCCDECDYFICCDRFDYFIQCEECKKEECSRKREFLKKLKKF